MKFIKQIGDDSPLLDQQLAAGLRGDFDLGWKLAQELEQKFPDNHRAAFNRAWYLMRQGKLLEGFECLSRGRWIEVFGDKRLPTDKPIYRNEPLEGKHLVICSEGGLGDEIINLRFAQNFAKLGAKVAITCDPSLGSVFARAPGVSSVIMHKGAPVVYHDYWVPAMSAGHILGIEYKDLSGEKYLFADKEYKKKWQKILAEKYPSGAPKIGLRFYGNPKFEHEQHRKFPQDGLIAAVGNRPWLSLQKEDTDLPLDTWEDTLALIDELDLVITSCTSVAHASAALGKETWIIIPVLPYYIWSLPGEKTPWYSSVTLFRQKNFGDWQNVFDDIKKALEGRK